MDLSTIIGTPVHAIDNKGIFGLRIISGVIVGIQFTHNKPKYCVGFGDSSVWVNNVAENEEDLLKLLKLPKLDEVKKKGANHNIKP